MNPTEKPAWPIQFPLILFALQQKLAACSLFVIDT
jgi:hypothetical protein